MSASGQGKRSQSLLKRRDILGLGGGAATRAVVGVDADSGSESESAIKAFLGSFKHTGGKADTDGRDRAIDDVVKAMNPLVRSIARSRLKETNPIAASLKLTLVGKSLKSDMDGRAYTAPLDGSTVTVKGITGDELELHLEIASDSFKQVFLGDDKGRTNTFRREGDALVLNVRVHSKQLPKDLLYKLSYGPA